MFLYDEIIRSIRATRQKICYYYIPSPFSIVSGFCYYFISTEKNFFYRLWLVLADSASWFALDRICTNRYVIYSIGEGWGKRCSSLIPRALWCFWVDWHCDAEKDWIAESAWQGPLCHFQPQTRDHVTLLCIYIIKFHRVLHATTS